MKAERYNYWARYVLEREAMFLETALNHTRNHEKRLDVELKLADVAWAITACKMRAEEQLAQEELSKTKERE